MNCTGIEEIDELEEIQKQVIQMYFEFMVRFEYKNIRKCISDIYLMIERKTTHS